MLFSVRSDYYKLAPFEQLRNNVEQIDKDMDICSGLLMV